MTDPKLAVALTPVGSAVGVGEGDGATCVVKIVVEPSIPVYPSTLKFVGNVEGLIKSGLKISL